MFLRTFSYCFVNAYFLLYLCLPRFILFCWYRINAVSNGQVRGDSYSEGCLGQTGTVA